ncbi:E3 ubiquitin-protein ligase Topors-like isoform X2 [Hetaerina americana]
MTPQLQERLAVQHIVAVRERSSSILERIRSRLHPRSSQNIPDFRARVYRDNLWVQPLSDFTNRFRVCTPLFYRENPAQVYRLVRWLQRELQVLLPENCPHRAFVMQTIVNNLFIHPIRSRFFATQLQPYLGTNTRHFIHEFAEYSRSPFDMRGHDRAATYLPHGPAAIEEVVLNSPTNSDYSEENIDDLLNSSGSDVEIIESGVLPPAPVAGPSGVVRSRAPHLKKFHNPILPLSNAETHEIISSSSSDDCEVVGTFKPRTPEVIDILSDDDEMQPSIDQSACTTIEAVDLRTPNASGERVVCCPDEATATPSHERTPEATSPSLLEASTERPRIRIKIEAGRIKRKAKRRRRHKEWSSSRESSSESSGKGSSRRKVSTRERWNWSDSGSDCKAGGGGERRIPSVVVPQPSFKAESSSVRVGGSGNEDNGSAKREGGGEHWERCKKRKKSKHSRRHKRRSHDDAEGEDRGEGTSGSGTSRRCKVCKHRHCHCNSALSQWRKSVKNHHRETTTEERESASGSSRSKSKGKRRSKFKYSESKYSDSSG